MRAAGWAVLALLLCCRGVQAQSSDAIRLELDDCEEVPGTTVHELVVLEVAPRRVLELGSTEPAATRAELTCEGGVAAIVVEEAGRSAPLRLEVLLSDLARSARPRALALAVAELIATSRLQRQPPVAAVVEPGETSNETLVLSEPTRSGAALWLAAGAARVAEPSMLGPTASLGVLGYWGALAISADLRVERAQRTQSVADLGLVAGSLALAPAWRLHASSADLLIGAGARVGFASLRGESRDPGLAGQSVTGLWFGPSAQVAVHVRLARRWALRVGVEAAYLTRTVRGVGANREPVLELRGLSLAALLGVSWHISSD